MPDPVDARPTAAPAARPCAGDGYRVQVYERIADVAREEWNGLLRGRSRTYSHEFWGVIEASGLNDFRYRHALVRDAGGRAVALASFYTVTTDLAIFAGGALRSLLARLRRVWPGFLKVRMLECGTPVTLNAPFVLGDAVHDDAARARIVACLYGALAALARRERHFLLVLRDLEARDAALAAQLRALGCHLVDSLPTTYLDIAWRTPEDYLSEMRSYYRSKLRKHLRAGAALGLRHELRAPFDELAETLCAQWQVVHAHASEYHREVLTPAFYRNFSQALGADAMVLLLYRGEELAGHVLLLRDGELLRWLYFGRQASANDSLYLYAGLQVVETAIRLGVRRLELGLTTYDVKMDLGARLSPIRLALCSPWRVIHPFVGLVYPWLNHAPPLRHREVFKAPAGVNATGRSSVEARTDPSH
jgi:predicted N-acyltransferase